MYCTDSITCEYFHLDEILSMGSAYIEMETAAFLRCLAMMKRRGNALLCVSDNSAAGQHLLGRSEEELAVYHRTREEYIPKLLLELAGE